MEIIRSQYRQIIRQNLREMAAAVCVFAFTFGSSVVVAETEHYIKTHDLPLKQSHLFYGMIATGLIAVNFRLRKSENIASRNRSIAPDPDCKIPSIYPSIRSIYSADMSQTDLFEPLNNRMN